MLWAMLLAFATIIFENAGSQLSIGHSKFSMAKTLSQISSISSSIAFSLWR